MGQYTAVPSCSSCEISEIFPLRWGTVWVVVHGFGRLPVDHDGNPVEGDIWCLAENHGKTRGKPWQTWGKTTSQLCSTLCPCDESGTRVIHFSWCHPHFKWHELLGFNKPKRASNSHLVSLKKVPQQPVHATITCIWYGIIAMNWCQYHVLVATPINKHHRLVSFVPPYTLSCIFKSCRFPGFVGDLQYFRGPCNMTRGGLAHSALESVTDIPMISNWHFYRIHPNTL